MNIFKRKNQQNIKNDRDSAVNDFRRQVPFNTYRPIEYRIIEGFGADIMIPEIDSCLSKLFEGEIDEGNGNTLDSIILDRAKMAMDDLSNQRIAHEELICSLNVQRQGAIGAFKDHVRQLQEQLEDVTDKMKEASKRADAEKFVKGGTR